MSWFKSSTQIDLIKQIASQVREEMQEHYEDLQTLCLNCSRVLRDKLNELGFRSIVVQGYFQIDEPDMSFYDDWDERDFNSTDEMEDAKHNALHYWVECNGLVVDITADQFNHELDDEIMEPVTVGTYIELERYVPKHRGWK